MVEPCNCINKFSHSKINSNLVPEGVQVHRPREGLGAILITAISVCLQAPVEPLGKIGEGRKQVVEWLTQRREEHPQLPDNNKEGNLNSEDEFYFLLNNMTKFSKIE